MVYSKNVNIKFECFGCQEDTLQVKTVGFLVLFVLSMFILLKM